MANAPLLLLDPLSPLFTLPVGRFVCAGPFFISKPFGIPYFSPVYLPAVTEAFMPERGDLLNLLLSIRLDTPRSPLRVPSHSWLICINGCRSVEVSSSL